ncbi:MAG TPA: hypothetical protein VGM90_07300 [Kofleriaceae bacterium]|jgi:hypothetical protein
MKRALLLVVFAACGTNQTPQPELDASLPACVPNRDGMITVDELPIALGATVNYYASPAGSERDVSFGGTTWDLSAENAADQVVAIGPTALKDQWYASQFSSGQFVVPSGDLDGVYHQDSQALWLDGLASQTDGAQKTLIRYVQPLPVLRFPIQGGDTYSATTALQADSTVVGLPFVGTDKLDVTITGGGKLLVPYVEFSPVLKVQTLATRTPSTGTPVVTKRTTIFMFECFGEIARAESRTDEPSPDFTKAAYLRRFALGVKP